MAALRPPGGELVEAALRPLLAEEIKAAEGWPELQLEPASWIEGDQVWVLELQPYDAPEVDGNLEETQQLEKTSLLPNACESLCQKSTLETGRSTCIKNKHTCPHCGKTYRWPSDLARHRRTHHGINVTKQRECKSESGPLVSIPSPPEEENLFVSPVSISKPKSKLTTNWNTRKPGLYFCDQCEKCYRWHCDLVRHQRAHHDIKAESKFMPKLEPMTGQSIHIENLHSCDQCEKAYRWRCDLVRHRRVHHDIKSEPTTFRPKSEPTTGQRTHVKKRYFCRFCGMGCRWPSDLNRHQDKCYRRKEVEQREHQSGAYLSDPVLFHLQEENTSVSPASTLRPKSKLTTNCNTRIDNLLICDYCGMGYQWPSHLALHQSVHHGIKTAKRREMKSEESPLVSLQEGNMFVSPEPKSKLTINQNTINKNLYICDQCAKVYQWHCNLVRHQRLHHGLKTVSKLKRNIHPKNLHFCDQCPKVYRWRCDLVRHRRVFHGIKTAPLQVISTFASCQKAISQNPRQNPNQCAHCDHICDHGGERFQWPSDLTQHAHTNSRERPYSCAICGSQFTRKVQLMKHLRLHKETRDSDGEEEDSRYQGGCGKDREDISIERLQWLPPQGTEELCEPFATSKACKHDACCTGAGNISEPPPLNSIWEIGSSGQAYIMSLGHSYRSDNCVTYDSSSTDSNLSDQSSLSDDDIACSDLISPGTFCDTSTPMSAACGADENAEDMLKKKGSPASPITSGQASLPSAVAGQNLKGTRSLSKKQDPPLVRENKPYACPKCLKQFNNKYDFKRHIVIHQQKKPHRCKTCGDRFAHRSYLLKHQRLAAHNTI